MSTSTRFSIAALAVAFLSIAASASADGVSPAAQKILNSLDADLKAGIAIGLDPPIDQLKKLGEGKAAVPVLVKYLPPAPGARGMAALDCLVRLGPDGSGATPALMNALKAADDFDRPGVIKALVAVRAPVEDVVPASVKMLPDADPSFRRTLITLLGNYGPAARDALPQITAMAKDRALGERTEVIIALARIGWPATKDTLLELCNAKDDLNARQAAASALGQTGPALAQAMPGVFEHLGSSELASVCMALGLAGPLASDTVPDLVKLLNQPGVDSSVCELLADIGPAAEPALPKLIELAGADPANRNLEYQRYQSIIALGAIRKPTPQVLQTLTRAVSTDHSMPERREAAKALGLLHADSPEVIKQLIEALSATEAQVQAAAAEALGDLGPAAKDSLPVLQTLLKSDDPQVLIHSIAATWRIAGDAEAEKQHLIKMLANALKSNQAELEWPAAEELVRIKSSRPEIIAALSQCLASHSDHSREFAATALGQLGRAAVEAVPALRKACEDPGYISSHVDIAAALWRIDGDAAYARKVLLDALKSDMYDSTRWRATATLVEIARSDPDTAAALKPLLNDRNPGVRYIAQQATASRSH